MFIPPKTIAALDGLAPRPRRASAQPRSIPATPLRMLKMET